MTRWVILTPAPVEPETADDISTLAKEAAGRPGVRTCSASPDLPGSVGGLGMTWDLTADVTPTAVLPDLPSQAEVVPLLPVASRAVPLAGPRVKRTLLLAVRPGTPPDVVARFEADLTAMPEHISAIRSWALSRVDTAQPGASTRWTHAWEQEFADVDGLTGEYLLHPYHWGYVDRWFDAEMPDSIVEPDLAHLFRMADGPVLG